MNRPPSIPSLFTPPTRAPQYSRGRGAGRAGIALAGLALLAGGVGVARAAKTSAPAPKPAAPAPTDQPSMQMTGMRAAVTRDGRPLERIEAEWARYDENDRILHLRGMKLHIFQDGAPSGTAACGSGTLWMSDRPDEGIGRNDVRLADEVTYRSPDGSVLSSPEMHYDNATSMLSSNAGFTQDMTGNGQTLRMSGQRFEIQLNRETSTLNSFDYKGNLLTIEAIDPGKNP